MVDHFSSMLTQKRLKQYKEGNKKTKANILKDYCQLTGVTRDTARQRFHRALGKMFWPRALPIPPRKNKRGRLKKYRLSHTALIGKLREISGEVCAERLHPMIPEYLKQLDKYHYLSIFLPEVVIEIKSIPLGSLKRIMKAFVSVNSKKGRKGNSAIFKQIPIDAHFGRFTKIPGYMEVDYVEHSGGDGSGRFAITGTYVDLFSQWTVRASALGKSLDSVSKIHNNVTSRIFHRIYEYHPDNAPAILQHLFTQAQNRKHEKFTLSRSRPYQKNDNAHVEQKNDDKVRKLVGYYRFDTEEELTLLNTLYRKADLYDNFFIASAKLLSKVKNSKGKVIKKTYDIPKTPYKRLLESRKISKEVKQKLRSVYRSLDMVRLRTEIDEIIKKLVDIQLTVP